MTHQDTHNSAKDMFPIGETQSQSMTLVPTKVLKGINSLKQAFQISLTRSGFSHEALADGIGKRREQVTKFASGSSGLTVDALEALINETGNLIPLQYLLAKYGLVAVKDPSLERKAQLLAELELLEA